MPVVHTIPFTTDNGLILIDAEYQGIKGHFILDTGADEVILNNKEVNSPNTQFETLTGYVPAEEVILSDFDIGGYSITTLIGYKSDLSSLDEMTDGKLLGILGGNVLKNMVMHLDKQRNIIQLYKSDQFSTELNTSFHSLPIKMVDNMILVEVELGNTTHNFVLDLAASSCLVDEQVIHDLNGSATQLSNNIELSCLGAKAQNLSAFELESLGMGGLLVKNLQVLSADFSHMATELDQVSISGILSFNQINISELIIDYQGQQLHIRP